MKKYLLFTFVLICRLVVAQKTGFSFNIGPSIPFGNFSKKNTAKSALIVDYNQRKVLAGFKREKSGFATLGWSSNASIDYLMNQKISISLSGGIQKNGTDFENLEIYFDTYNQGQGDVPVKISQPDFIFKYFDLNIFYNYKYRVFNTQIGPHIGLCITDFPNYERAYLVNGQSIIVTHMIKENNLKTLEYGIQIRQIYDINNSLHVGLNASLNFS